MKEIAPKHTPTPWNREDGGEDNRGSVIFGPTGETIAETPGGSFDGENGDEQDWANAAFIVRAVNAHDELVALQKAHDAFAADVAATLRLDWSGPEKLRSIHKLVERLDSDILEAKAALAKAEGVKP